jgi:hypothetical protein
MNLSGRALNKIASTVRRVSRNNFPAPRFRPQRPYRVGGSGGTPATHELSLSKGSGAIALDAAVEFDGDDLDTHDFWQSGSPGSITFQDGGNGLYLVCLSAGVVANPLVAGIQREYHMYGALLPNSGASLSPTGEYAIPESLVSNTFFNHEAIDTSGLTVPSQSFDDPADITDILAYLQDMLDASDTYLRDIFWLQTAFLVHVEDFENEILQVGSHLTPNDGGITVNVYDAVSLDMRKLVVPATESSGGGTPTPVDFVDIDNILAQQSFGS